MFTYILLLCAPGPIPKLSSNYHKDLQNVLWWVPPCDHSPPSLGSLLPSLGSLLPLPGITPPPPWDTPLLSGITPILILMECGLGRGTHPPPIATVVYLWWVCPVVRHVWWVCTVMAERGLRGRTCLPFMVH